MEASDVRTQGDKFFLSFLVAFVFVYFGIVLKPSSQEEVGARREAITSQRKLVEVLKRQLRLKMESEIFLADKSAMLLNRHAERRSQSASMEKLDSALDGQSTDSGLRSMASKGLGKGDASLKEEAELTERLAKASTDLATLISESAKETSHSIPFLSISIPESTVLSLFPLGAFAGLLRLLYFRRALLGSAISPKDRLPIWAGPLPTYMLERSRFRWFAVNVAMLTLVVLISWFTGDYLLAVLVATEDALKAGFARLYAVVGIVSLVAYLRSLVQAVLATEDKSDAIFADLEFE